MNEVRHYAGELEQMQSLPLEIKIRMTKMRIQQWVYAFGGDAYCQESTRYCNYGKGKFGEEITVIKPCFWDENTLGEKVKMDCWRIAMRDAEDAYFALLDEGCSPQEARSVLPNSLKTEVVMTANIREWRHFLKLRCSPAAHPQMREVALILLDKVHWLIPVCFDDIWSEYHAEV